MEQVELSFAGLEAAWNSGLLTMACGRRPWLPPPSLEIEAFPARTNDAATLVPVLIATCPGRSSALFDRSLLTSLHRVDRVYCVESVPMADFGEFESCCRRYAPRLLLVDVALIESETADALHDLRRRLPATDWLLGWEAPSPQALNAAVRCQVRGCIDWAASGDQLAQALDAVLAGVLWFSRPVLQALYLSVLEPAPTLAPPRSGAASTSADLTSREDEVRSLMRKGMTNKQIAVRLGISVNTVKKHVAHVLTKCGLHGRRQQVA